MKEKPQRMCVACRELKDKPGLVRVVSYNGEISVDEAGKKNGRGAYLCKSAECIKRAGKINLLAKAFKCAVDRSIYDVLAEKYGQN